MNVDLAVYDFFENVTLLLGWIINNAVWSVLTSTMIAALPFLALFVKEWYDARRVGEDEGNKGLLALNRIETTLYVMLLVYAFAAYPLMTVQFKPATINQQHLEKCGTSVITGAGSSAGAAIGGQSAQVPIWWATAHALSIGITNAMIAALPCQTDYTYIRTELQTSAIEDPALRREVAHFRQWCYGAARARLFREKGSISDLTSTDTTWLGSDFFLNTPGYYDSLRAKGPVKTFPYVQSQAFDKGTPPSMGGYPMCDQWWSASGNGLYDRLHDEIAPSVRQYLQGLGWGGDAQDYAIRALLAHNNSVGNVGATISSGGGGNGFDQFMGSAAGYFGSLLGFVPAQGMLDASARAMPMVQYIILMAIVLAMPFVIVFSGYSVQAVGILTFAYGGAIALTFWFQLTRWLQNNLIELVFESQGRDMITITGLFAPYDNMILQLVTATMLFIFPPLWIAMLGWAGYKTGATIGSALGSGSSESRSAGKQGGNKAQGAAAGGAKGKFMK